MEINYSYLKLIIHATKEAPEVAAAFSTWISNFLAPKIDYPCLK